MNKSLVDTDTFSEILKGRDQELVSKATQYLQEYGHFTFSSVTVMEIVRGYCLVDSQKKLTRFLASLADQEILPFVRSTAELAGRIDADLQRAGLPIGRADPMIAATAIEYNLVLVTGNTNHFARIRSVGYSLELDNWRPTDD